MAISARWPSERARHLSPVATSARWPRHWAAAQDVGVHVGHRLASLRAGIEDNPVAGVRDALGDCYLVGMRDEIGQQSVAAGG